MSLTDLVELVCCAFSFCWWAYDGRLPNEEPAEQPEDDLPGESAGRGETGNPSALAGGGKGVAGAVGDAVALLWRVFSDPPRRRS